MRTLTLWLALLAACSSGSPYARRKEYQAHQARRLAAAELDPEARAWRAVRRMRVRVHAAPDYRARDRAWRDSFAEQIARANAVLEQALGVRLEVEDARDWQPRHSSQDMQALLDELTAHDPGDDVDWVIGLIGSMPIAALSFHDLGRAAVLGRHLVLRDMNDAEEQRLISENLDTLDEDERRRLYLDRKRHKQTVVLLHELAHTLSAIHTTDIADVMHPSYDNRMRAFAEPNLVLMRKVLEQRQRPEPEQDGQALVAELSAYVRQAPWDGWVAEERAEYVDRLERALVELSPPEATGPVATAASPPPTEPPEWDASALPEADRLVFAQARADMEAGKLKEAWQAVHALAERHPRSYPAQHFACTLAMRAGLAVSAMRPYCDRMTALAVETAKAAATDEPREAPATAPAR